MWVCTVRSSGTSARTAPRAARPRRAPRRATARAAASRAATARSRRAAHHAHVVHLAHLGNRARRGGRALAHAALRLGRLDVDDHVGAAERALRPPPRCCRRRVCACARPVSSGTPTTRSAKWRPPAWRTRMRRELDSARRAWRERGADALVGAATGAVHQDVDDCRARAAAPRSPPARPRTARPPRRPPGAPRATSSRPDQHRERAREVRGEVQRVRREGGGAAFGATRAGWRPCARRVDHDHDDEHRERPPRRHPRAWPSSPPISRRSDSTAMTTDTSIRNALSPSAARCSALPWP